jgi:hypothetical protein
MGEYVIRGSLELVEALASRKNELGLSNAFVEHQLQMADNSCDKILGRTQRKGMSIPVMLDMIELFGCRLVIQVDAETEARMQSRWERRDARKVHPPRRLSGQLMDIAKLQFYKRLSNLGNEARKAKLPREARSNIARVAAVSRWNRYRAAVKAAVSEARKHESDTHHAPRHQRARSSPGFRPPAGLLRSCTSWRRV